MMSRLIRAAEFQQPKPATRSAKGAGPKTRVSPARTIKASEFKAKCLAIMDDVARTGASVVITKNGKPIAELVPHRGPRPKLFGALKGRVFITGDIISPLD